MSSSYLQTLNHRHVDSSASTNSELIEQLQSGKLDASLCHLLTAATQTAGRGQYTRSWQSPRGNVYLSLYHPVSTPVSGLLSLLIGLELAKMPIIERLNDALQAANLTPIGVKWANDLGYYPPLTGNNAIHYFKKLAGILIEPVWLAGKLIGVVMGVGLNVKTSPMLTEATLEGMSYQALSLGDICDLLSQHQPDHGVSLPDLSELYAQIAEALVSAMNTFACINAEKSGQLPANQPPSRQPHTPVMTTFLQDFAQRDALAGQYLRVTQEHQGKTAVLKGAASGIDTNGCLQLRRDDGSICALFTGRIDVIGYS